MEQQNQEQQELMYKLSMFEQQMQQIQQQLKAIDQGIAEIGSLNLGLDDFKGAEGKEVLAPLGKGIFAKTKLLSEDLIVDIGGKNFVKKTIPQTQELIQGQIKKLEEIKKELHKNLESLNQELTQTFMSAQQQQPVEVSKKE